MADQPIRVIVADDHPVFREGFAMLLEPLDDIEVVATAADGRAAIDAVAAHRPDVVIMDIQMPRLNGIEATRTIAADQPGVGVLVMTMAEDDGTVFSAIKAGARGYLLKGADQDEVVSAIKTVAAGGVVFGAALAGMIAHAFTVGAGVSSAPFPELTEREREVLDLLAAGRSNGQIASSLFLSPKTIRNNVSTILGKLQAADRAEAIVRARDAGLGRG